MIVLEWFHSVLPHIEKDPLYQKENIVCPCIYVQFCNIRVTTSQLQGCNRQTRALILSIAVCYYAKLQQREEFEEFISPLLISSFLRTTLFLDDPCAVFKKEIIKYICIYFELNHTLN